MIFLCRVELWGVDTWVSSHQPIIQKTVLVNELPFSAKGLLPFTRYLLKVFLLNDEDLYDQAVSNLCHHICLFSLLSAFVRLVFQPLISLQTSFQRLEQASQVDSTTDRYWLLFSQVGWELSQQEYTSTILAFGATRIIFLVLLGHSRSNGLLTVYFIRLQLLT